MTSLPELQQLQRWFAHVVEHPDSADVAMRSKKANALVPRAAVQRGDIIATNPRMSAADMMQVYNGGYLARLVDVLLGDYGALHYVLGGEAFYGLITRYLKPFPSRHANLNQLGRELPAFIKRQRVLPDRAFVAELALVELAMATAFDADEFEPMAADAMAAIPAEQWPAARFAINPSLRLLALRHPINAFYAAWKDDKSPEVPAAERSWLAVFRRHGRVWRKPLTKSSFDVLSALAAREQLGDALACAKPGEPVGEWFQGFAADGLFMAVSVS